MKKRLLGILLSLALMAGMITAMGLTAYADPDVTYVDAEGNLIDANTGEVVGNMNGAPETGDPGTEIDPETGDPVVPPEQETDPETGEAATPPEQETEVPSSGGQELDPVTGEPLPVEQDGQQAEPTAPEEPVEPVAPEEIPVE